MGARQRSRSPSLLLTLTWVIAKASTARPHARSTSPASTRPRDARRLRLRPLPQRARAGAPRLRLRRRLHGRLVAAAGRRGLLRRLALDPRQGRPAGDRLRDLRDALLAHARRPRRSAAPPPTSRRSSTSRPALLLIALSLHALPELFALFLPLAAWTIASRRERLERAAGGDVRHRRDRDPDRRRRRRGRDLGRLRGLLRCACRVAPWLYFLKQATTKGPTSANGRHQARHRQQLPGRGARERASRARRLLGAVVRAVPGRRSRPRGDRRRARRPAHRQAQHRREPADRDATTRSSRSRR